ncbi:HMG box-containing protein 1 [Trichoplax sp. H2]|nr:HMG box-containing protein 1 [Trichoplax sp. H2]|eukprot:RDD43804.1 HMG box-containing protein 1 [Trichoplax sp. H2]
MAEDATKNLGKFAQPSNFHSIGYDAKMGRVKSDDPYLLSSDTPLQHDVDFGITQSKDTSNIADLLNSGTSRPDTTVSFYGLDQINTLEDQLKRRGNSDYNLLGSGQIIRKEAMESKGEFGGDHASITPSWLCFMKGTKIKFSASNQQVSWIAAEELGKNDKLVRQLGQIEGPTTYAPFGLKLMEVKEIKGNSDKRKRKNLLIMRFSSTVNGQPRIAARCLADHPFYVKEKGWSSFCPELTNSQYGINSKFLKINDVCIPPPSNAEAFKFDKLNLTAMDSSAALTLSRMGMAKKYKSDESPMGSPSKKSNGSDNGSNSSNQQSRMQSDRAKRPMNAFMLFAKKYRVEITQAHPGKDNRAISVILGDKWKSMETTERQQYAEKARILAEEHKKNFPDCWKRKKTLKKKVS